MATRYQSNQIKLYVFLLYLIWFDWYLQGRGNRGGGEAGGQLASTTLKMWGRHHHLWSVKVVHFYFCLFLHVNLGLYQKIVDQIRRVFSFGQGLPWTSGDVCPPPLNLEVLPAALDISWSLSLIFRSWYNGRFLKWHLSFAKNGHFWPLEITHNIELEEKTKIVPWSFWRSFRRFFPLWPIGAEIENGIPPQQVVGNLECQRGAG